jgi:hypothetical protein
MTPDQAAAAAISAARAAQPHVVELIDALVVPAGCLQLRSWQESAAAEEPPGEVAASVQLPRTPAAAAAAGTGAGVRSGADSESDVLQPGSEVVITLAVMDTSRRLNVVQQEIQARVCPAPGLDPAHSCCHVVGSAVPAYCARQPCPAL